MVKKSAYFANNTAVLHAASNRNAVDHVLNMMFDNLSKTNRRVKLIKFITVRITYNQEKVVVD